MKNDGTSNPYLRWSAIVYIAYWSILILGDRILLGCRIFCSPPDPKAWFEFFVLVNAVIFVFLGMPLLATLVYARALSPGKSAFGFAAWISSMMIFPCHIGILNLDTPSFIRGGLPVFFMIFGAVLILPVALSAFSAKIRYTIPMILLLYALYSIMWIFMIATLGR